MLKRVVAMAAVFTLVMSGSLIWAGPGQGSTTRAQKRDRVKQCDQARSQLQSRGVAASGFSYGPGDGTGNQGVEPKDGTGYGRKAGICNGTGACDGSGPLGTTQRTRLGRPPRP